MSPSSPMRGLLLLAAISGCSSSMTGTAGNGDASTSAVATLNGCAPSAYVEASGAPTVSFGGVSGSPLFGYAPRCLRVPVGATLIFDGDFSVHPLSPGTSPGETTAGSANNPIGTVSSGASVPVTFPAAGVYPYFCQMHYAAGMNGAILVQ